MNWYESTTQQHRIITLLRWVRSIQALKGRPRKKESRKKIWTPHKNRDRIQNKTKIRQRPIHCIINFLLFDICSDSLYVQWLQSFILPIFFAIFFSFEWSKANKRKERDADSIIVYVWPPTSIPIIVHNVFSINVALLFYFYVILFDIFYELSFAFFFPFFFFEIGWIGKIFISLMIVTAGVGIDLCVFDWLLHITL